MDKFRATRTAMLRGSLYVAGIVAVWAIATGFFAVPDYLLPSPSAVFASLMRLPDYYARHFSFTLTEALGGLVAGVAFGVFTASAMTLSRAVAHALNPLLVASQAFPREALAPILVVVFGFGVESKIVVAALVCFFPIAINTLRGLQDTPQHQVDMLKVNGANALQIFLWGRVPFAAPYFLAALRMSTIMAVVGAVVGEFVGGGGHGLGYVIQSARSDFGTDRVFAALLLLWLMSATLYALAAILERAVLLRLGLAKSHSAMT